MLDVLDSLHPLADKLGGEPLDSGEAAELVQLCVEAERVVGAMRMMAARAVDSDYWQARGFRSAAAWMAAEAGTPVGPAIAAMETLSLLDNLPATAAALREGRLSLAQVNEIADVASEWPATEQPLLDAAAVLSLTNCGKNAAGSRPPPSPTKTTATDASVGAGTCGRGPTATAPSASQAA